MTNGSFICPLFLFVQLLQGFSLTRRCPRGKPDDVARIIRAAASGNLLDDLLYADPESGRQIEKQKDMPFFKKQPRNVLGLSERIEPT